VVAFILAIAAARAPADSGRVTFPPRAARETGVQKVTLATRP
jgi:hypothetical protein